MDDGRRLENFSWLTFSDVNLSLVRLLANRARVLLLDEPTANLDVENRARVDDRI